MGPEATRLSGLRPRAGYDLPAGGSSHPDIGGGYMRLCLMRQVTRRHGGYDPGEGARLGCTSAFTRSLS